MTQLPSVLFTWIGGSDRKAAQSKITLIDPKVDEIGAIARCLYLDKAQYGTVVLLADKEAEDGLVHTWLKRFCEVYLPHQKPTFILEFVNVAAMDRPKLYQGMQTAISKHSQANSTRTYLLSSGTPAMHLCWTLLAHTEQYRARLLDVSKQEGVKEVAHWLELAHAFLPVLPDNVWKFFADCGAGVEVENIIGTHPKIEQAKGLADLVANSKRDDYSVLILGETGSGKESIARLIHDNSHPPAKAKFVAINCGAISESLLESELFGYMKGAFTGASNDKMGLFEAAGEGGTVFLDEIGEMPLSMQTKLLRVLQERKVRRIGGNKEEEIKDRRIVAATHRSLIDDVGQGRFRADLYYRLNVIEIHLPALRDRLSDLDVLVDHFLSEINENLSIAITLMPDYKQPLLQHDWPGNIRELENTLRRAALYAQAKGDGIIDAALLRGLILPRPAPKIGNDWGNRSLEGLDLERLLDDVRYHYYQRLLSESPGLSRAELAKRLGCTNPTLNDCEDNWRQQNRKVSPRQTRISKKSKSE